MRIGVVTFPGSNDDDDAARVVGLLGAEAVRLWHKDTDLKNPDAVILPGGFSYGDYLRCGAMARFSPVMKSVAAFAERGGFVLGICNGFQILCESGLLPGALIRNRDLTFVCDDARLRVETSTTPITRGLAKGELLTIPIKHGEGCWIADAKTVAELEANDQILLRYVDAAGQPTDAANPNGALGNVAGVTNRTKNVFGMMPHPEHAAEALVGGTDGMRLFRSLADEIAARKAA